MASSSSSAVNSPPGGPLGEVEVAEDLLADADRDADKAGHRRMARRKPRRHGMGSKIRNADRDRLADPAGRGSLAPGRPPDSSDQLIVQADLQKLFEFPIPAEHAERCVPGTQKVPGRPDDLAQHDWEAQLAGHQSIGAQQPAQPSLTGQHVISAVGELREQLIQFEPGHVGKTQSPGGLRRTGPAWLGPWLRRQHRIRLTIFGCGHFAHFPELASAESFWRGLGRCPAGRSEPDRIGHQTGQIRPFSPSSVHSGPWSTGSPGRAPPSCGYPRPCVSAGEEVRTMVLQSVYVRIKFLDSRY